LSAAILGKLFPSLGADVGGKYVRNVKYNFNINDVSKDRIDLGALDRYLADAKLRYSYPSISSLLEADDLYVICATLKARRLELETESSNTVGGDVKLPDLKLGSGKFKVSATRKANDSRL
jgi:hypothetical protein